MEKTKISALILDYGGVISKPQNPDRVKQMRQLLGLDSDDFVKIYRRTRAEFDNGQLSAEAYWRSAIKGCGLEPNDADVQFLIQQDMASWTEVDEAMLAFIAQSKGQVHKLAIISNMPRETRIYIAENFQWLKYFDECVFSCEVGINKPAPEIYQICLDRLAIPAQSCLFVDDSEENVLSAMRSGMHGIHFASFPQFRRDLGENYILVNGLKQDKENKVRETG